MSGFLSGKRSNQTHESKSDPEAQLASKSQGKEVKLSYSGNLLVENRSGLIVSRQVWEATGIGERCKMFRESGVQQLAEAKVSARLALCVSAGTCV